MLLGEIIRETASENREIFSLAQRLLNLYQKNPQREYNLSDIDTSGMFNNVKVKFDARYDRSLYNPRTKEVLIKLGGGDLKSELIHELQHALDDIKSQGKFRNEPGEYLTRQSEVNARLSQAMADIQSALGKARVRNIDWQNPRMREAVERLIASYLKKHQLTPQQGIDSKRYQRLLKRIYSYVLELQRR